MHLRQDSFVTTHISILNDIYSLHYIYWTFKISCKFQITSDGQHIGLHKVSITYIIMTQWAAKINKTSINA